MPMVDARMPVVRCDRCHNEARPGESVYEAWRNARLCGWDIPAGEIDDWIEGFWLCPACRKADRWPGACDRMTIRLADGDHAADVRLDAMPDALVG